MAVIVSAETVTVRTPDRALLDGVSLGVQTGDRIGVLGLNGAGKTTLLQVLAGVREPDAGRVAISRGSTVAVVGQQVDFAPELTVRTAVLGGGDHRDHVWASDSGIREIFAGLGLTGIGLDSVIGELSGGEKRRVSLAAALVTDADLLVLDEPTNHLDIEGIAWLAAHVIARRGAVIAVTHDRWFLDAVAKVTWEVVDGAVEIREGGYSDWIFARAERTRMAAATEERRRNMARKELAWLRRGAPARTSKPRYRIEAAEALIADVPPLRNPTELVALARHRLGRDVLELVDATVTLPDGRVLLDRISRIIGPGDRIAILGPNGAGKSTLLRALAGELAITSGKVKRGSTVRLGFVRQEPEVVDPELRVLDAITEVAGAIEIGGKSMTASQLAERFGFTPGQQRQQVARLSGGERRRLQLLRVLASEPNVLLLDEPTNDLDTDTLAALEDLLDSWAGTLIVVSHDRYLVERATDTVLAVAGDGTVTHRPGGVDQYLADRRAAVADAVAGATESKPGGPPDRRSQSAPSGAEVRALEKELASVERRIEKLQQQATGARVKLADYDQSDYQLLGSEMAKIKAMDDEVSTLEERWLELSTLLE